MSIHMNPIKQLVTARRSRKMKLIPMLFYILDRLIILDSILITVDKCNFPFSKWNITLNKITSSTSTKIISPTLPTCNNKFILKVFFILIYFKILNFSLNRQTPDPNPLRTLHLLKDPSPTKRAVTGLSWSPDGGPKLAAAYSDSFWKNLFDHKENDSYIWNIGNIIVVTIMHTLPCITLLIHLFC